MDIVFLEIKNKFMVFYLDDLIMAMKIKFMMYAFNNEQRTCTAFTRSTN